MEPDRGSKMNLQLAAVVRPGEPSGQERVRASVVTKNSETLQCEEARHLLHAELRVVDHLSVANAQSRGYRAAVGGCTAPADRRDQDEERTAAGCRAEARGGH